MPAAPGPVARPDRHTTPNGAIASSTTTIPSLEVAPLTPDQLRRRERVEGLIRLASPALNLVLAVGERVSRLVEPEDHEYYPPRTRSGSEPPPRTPREPGGAPPV